MSQWNLYDVSACINIFFSRHYFSAALTLTDLLGVYHEYDLSGRYGYLYVLVILNISVAYAFVVLATFYSTLKSKLKPFEPVGKFLCIKFVIFFAFWQVCVMLHQSFDDYKLTLRILCGCV